MHLKKNVPTTCNIVISMRKLQVYDTQHAICLKSSRLSDVGFKHIMQKVAHDNYKYFFLRHLWLHSHQSWTGHASSTSIIAIFKHIDGLVQDFGNSSANALELPQSCTKPPVSS